MKPQSMEVQLVLTATQPISHHDPAVQNESNTLTFNRRKQRVTLNPARNVPVHQHLIDAFCEAYPVIGELAAGFDTLTFAEFAATALVRTVIDWYTGANGGEGAGLFSGMMRYQMLERRLQTSAICSHNLTGFWSRLTASLQLPVQPSDKDADLVRFFALPEIVQRELLAALVHDARAVVSIARVWHDAVRMQSPEYAAKKGGVGMEALAGFLDAFEGQPERVMTFNANDLRPAEQIAILEVPYISPNGLRHMIREAAWVHLAATLDIPAQWPGEGPYPQSVEALFRNGGNLRQGASEPIGASALGAAVRKAFPSLDLLGGNVDNFGLDQGRLEVAAWILCAENAEAELPEAVRTRPMMRVSAFEMLDDVTQTRQAVNGLHQMIYNFETLVQGTEIYMRLRLHPFTHPLTQGALLAAVETWAAAINRAAGKAAEGFSTVTVEEVGRQGMTGTVEQYEAYLRENADALREELLAGTLGSGAKSALLS